jgi:hypothetical protein
MEALYTLNLLAGALLLFWPMWFSRRVLRLRGLDPFVITMLVGLPFQLARLFAGPWLLIDEGLYDTGYQFALLMGNIQTLAQTLGLLLFYRFFAAARVEVYLPGQRVLLSNRDLVRGSKVFLVLFLVSFYLLASAEFGLVNWLMNPRLGYQLYRSGQGHWYALAMSSLSVSFVLRMMAQAGAGSAIGWALFYFAAALVLGSKGVLLAFFGCLLIFLWLQRWRHLSRLIVIGAPVVGAAMLGNLYMALNDAFDLVSILAYFDYYKIAADYYRGYLSGEVPLFDGQVALTSLWAYVPRAIWTAKPIVYGVLYVNEIFFPGQAELTNTPEFGGAVESFADFGVAGVVIFGLLGTKSMVLALLSYWLFRRPGLRFRPTTLASVGLVIVQFAPVFGQFFPGLLYLVLLLAVLAILHLLRSGRRTPLQGSMRSQAS